MEICVLLCWFSGIFAILGVLGLLWLDMMDAFLDQSYMVEKRAVRYEAQAAAQMAWEMVPELKAVRNVISVCLDCGCDHREMVDLNHEYYRLWLTWSRYRDLARPHFVVSY